MRIEFESREEIQKLATVLQADIFPAALVIDVDDLRDACRGDGDLPLPWNADGFHLPLMPVTLEEQVDKRVNKKVHKVTADKKVYNERLYTYPQVFPRGTVWEEVEKDGKKYLRRVISGSTPFQREEDMVYLAGQLDGWFQLVNAGQTTMKEVAKITGQMEPFLVDLCRIWNRRMCGEPWGRKWFKVHPNGSYTIKDGPDA